MSLKKITKKWGAIALCSAALVGGTVGTLLSPSNGEIAKAYYYDDMSNGAGGIVNNGETADLPISLYIEEGYWYADAVRVYFNNGTTPAGNYLMQFSPDSSMIGLNLKIVFQKPYLDTDENLTFVSAQSVYNKEITSTDPISITYSTPVDMYGESGYFEVSLKGSSSMWDKLSEKMYLRNFTLKMSDTTAPVISGYEGVYYTNYDNPASLSSIMSKISAYDETDGTVSINIDSDGYTGKERTLGSHKVKLSASDAAGNKSEITIDIIVTDGTKPVINGKKEYTSNMSSPLTETQIRAGLTATDNYDNSVSIQLVEDNFTANKTKAGSYTIKYKATDSSGNVSDICVVTITNKDDIKPTLSGTATYTVSSIGKITVDSVKSGLSANDNIDTNLTINLIEDNYSENSSIVGDHTMKFNVVDASGNISETFTVTITVRDDIPPVFWVTDDFFTVEESLTLTHDQIVAVLLAQNNMDTTQVLEYKVVKDNYTANASTVGKYAVSYQLKMTDGEVIELSSEIDVVGEETIAPVEKEKWYNKVWDFVKDHWLSITLCGVAIVAIFTYLSSHDKKNKNNRSRRRR